MTAPGALAPDRPGPKARSGRPAAWWWVLAFAGLLPTVVPLVTLVAGVLTGDAATSVPLDRLAVLLRNTLALAAAVTVTAVAIGVGTAWVTTKTDLPGRRLWSVIVAVPLVIPSYVFALTILGAGGPGGAISQTIGFDLPSPTGFLGAWLALSVFSVPYVHLSVVPALRMLDPALEEASRGLGASRWRTFRTITLPMLQPAVASSALLVALYAVSDFGAVSLLRFDTFTRAVYAQYQGRIDRQPALVLAFVLMLVALAIVVIERRTRRRAAYHRGRPARRTHRIELGAPASAAAWTGLGVLSAFSLFLPIGVLVTWLARGLSAGQEIGAVWAEAARSLGVSLAAGVLAAIIAVPIAVVTVRHSSRISAAIETTVWVGYAVPHITVGLAMVTFALAAVRPLYQTVVLVVIAYAAMFLPQSVGAARDALQRISPDIELASRSLGRSSLATAMRITVPLMARGLVAGGALVFLTAMKELPATLLLRPNGFETLAIRVWAATGEGFYTRASMAALVLLAVSAVPLAAVTLRELDD